ncbi:hypothetical protein SLH49_01155 [Cognatiyoonia sp. IB215446]|uniref:hypothetical protein n=1 Tax=Cognatiyoonia sp. IB215446 TaxID=3097355 RepID=UPI002A10F45E|nr:hypothetical protein [Cognatiyoonia sp. IB215446]MDX8346578.1 hypothetical protein [Cognatiyoonia sp. IB215446]
MSDLTLIKTRLQGGIWEGEIMGAVSDAPKISVTHQGAEIEGVAVSQGDTIGTWRLTFPLPQHLISDGVLTFVIGDDQGRRLGSLDLLAGEALAGDIRAELNLLRDELDMLKKAFRQHCRET